MPGKAPRLSALALASADPFALSLNVWATASLSQRNRTNQMRSKPSSSHADFFHGLLASAFLPFESEPPRSLMLLGSGDNAGWATRRYYADEKINLSRLYPRLKTRRPGGKSSGLFLI